MFCFAGCILVIYAADACVLNMPCLTIHAGRTAALRRVMSSDMTPVVGEMCFYVCLNYCFFLKIIIIADFLLKLLLKKLYLNSKLLKLVNDDLL